MSKTVFILGAGASYACSSRTPLINQFFSRAKETGGICDKMRQTITATLEAKFGFSDSGLLRGQPNLEDVFSIVQMHRDIHRDMQDLFGQTLKKEFEKFDSGFSQNRLEDLIYELITTVTWRELNGSGDLYDSLVSSASPEDVFVTFNYDLQLHRALERTASWSILDGYGLDFEALLDKDTEWRKPEAKAKSKPELLKLHGSLNWLVSNGYFTDANRVMDHSDSARGRHFPDAKGFYLWGFFDPRRSWHSICLGKAGFGKTKKNNWMMWRVVYYRCPTTKNYPDVDRRRRRVSGSGRVSCDECAEYFSDNCRLTCWCPLCRTESNLQVN